MPPKRNNMSTAAIERLISQRVVDALLDYEANQNSGNRNGNRNEATIQEVKNSYVRTVEHDAAYEMPWKNLMKMMTESYYSRSKIKKLETELEMVKLGEGCMLWEEEKPIKTLATLQMISMLKERYFSSCLVKPNLELS
uniref:Reverse transcriptase domain-containing protein n=1 Tax=Tanacetum cinerariifolium TaxID=118510 RepID=A0A6L2NHI2_TANCI|nr:hypothetical protein [Tanacetum cinerariifolium]